VQNVSATVSDSREANPVEQKWISLDGVRTRFLRCGSGPPLVLLHGLGGYAFSWRFFLPALLRQATAYAVDMPGAGFSEPAPHLNHSLRASAERMLRFLDAANINSCDLLGTSHGGAVAMMVAAISPERVRRLILVAPVNPWSAHGKWLAPLAANPVVAPMLLRLGPHLRATHDFWLRRLYGNPRRIPAGALEGYSIPLRKPGALDRAFAIVHTWNRDLRELKSALPRIAHIPTLLVWGSRDRAVSPASALPLSQQFKTCCLVMLEGAGHLPYEEMPDEFNRAVLEFLTTVPAASDSLE